MILCISILAMYRKYSAGAVFGLMFCKLSRVKKRVMLVLFSAIYAQIVVSHYEGAQVN